MCAKVPLTRAEFVDIEGFTEKKYAKFGEEFLAMVYSFLRAHDLLHLFPDARVSRLSACTTTSGSRFS